MHILTCQSVQDFYAMNMPEMQSMKNSHQIHHNLMMYVECCYRFMRFLLNEPYRHPVIFSEDDWGVQSLPKRIGSN